LVRRPRLLLLAAGDDQYHDHGKIGLFLKAMLSSAGFNTTYAAGFEALTGEHLSRHDVVVMYAVSASLSAARLAMLLDAVRGAQPNDRGKPVGFVGLHGVTTSFQDNEEWKRLIGASFVSHPDMGPVYRFTVRDTSHPVTRGVEDFNLIDELYLFNEHAPFTILLSCLYEGTERPVAWHKPYGQGRIFYLALGHDTEQLGDENVRQLIVNGIHWTTEERA
jgi:type 1 glutamine amidotransferase